MFDQIQAYALCNKCCRRVACDINVTIYFRFNP